MKSVLRITLMCGFLFALGGCASVPEVPYDRAAENIHVIGVPTPAFPSDANVLLASDVGQSFGLVGALVDMGLQAQRDKELKAAVASQGFNASQEFSVDLMAALQKDGYTVVPISADRSKGDLLPQMPTSPQPVDAYLDVAVYGYGYVAAGIGHDNPYRPYLTLRCKLVRASDGAVLMQDAVMLNNAFPTNLKAVSLSPIPQYQFATTSDLTADPRQAVDGLRNSLTQVTTSVADLVK